MFIGGAQVGGKLICSCILAFCATVVQAGNCEYMADMAKDIASLRDIGVPLTAVEARLRRDVSDPDGLALGLIVARLVYRTRGTAKQLRNEVLRQCK